MPVAEARAIVPHLAICAEDPPSDRRALQKLAAWAECYSPIVGLEEGPAPECLLLDITGCAACFHGEDRLAQRALDEFRHQGWLVQVARADTVGAAWALSRQSEVRGQKSEVRGQKSEVRGQKSEVRGQKSEVSRQGSELLSAACCLLRLPAEALQTLAELGIERIEQLIEMPRNSVPGRFGPLVLRRLDQLLGRVPELIVPCRLRPEVQARCSFEYATDRRAVLDHAVDRLLERIATILGEQQRGAKHLECWFYHDNAEPSRLDVRLYRPSQSAAHLRKLLATRMEPLQMVEPVSGICVRVPDVEIMTGRQSELFEEQPRAEELAGLIDRLVSRLGREAVTFATLVPDPQPEYACRFDPAIAKRGERRETRDERRGKKNLPLTIDNFQLPIEDQSHPPIVNCQLSIVHCQSSPLVPRPSSLAAHPSPLEVDLAPEGMPRRLRRAGQEHVVTRSWGPERIETGWWRGQDIQRDYYIVETDDGTRWWIFRRTKDERWFLHGCFD
jgi:protein ImuB